MLFGPLIKMGRIEIWRKEGGTDASDFFFSCICGYREEAEVVSS